MTSDNSVQFILQVIPNQEDDEAADRTARQLLKEVRELDIVSAQPLVTNEAPDGTKAGNTINPGKLLIAVLPPIIPSFIQFIQAWVLRGANRTVKMKVQVGDRMIETEYSPAEMTPDQIAALIQKIGSALKDI